MNNVLDMNWDFILYSAHLQCEQRQNPLRQPDDMPLETYIARLKDHVVSSMQSMINNPYKVWDVHEFVTQKSDSK